MSGGGHGGQTVVAMEANSWVRDRVRARQKALERDDRHINLGLLTDTQTHTRSVHYMMIFT